MNVYKALPISFESLWVHLYAFTTWKEKVALNIVMDCNLQGILENLLKGLLTVLLMAV